MGRGIKRKRGQPDATRQNNPPARTESHTRLSTAVDQPRSSVARASSSTRNPAPGPNISESAEAPLFQPTTTTTNPVPKETPTHSDPSPKEQTLTRPSRGTKLPALPPHLTTSKRPLLRPAIPSKYSSSASPSSPQNRKVVYVSARTPFMSAAKRVIRLLDLADKRAVQGVLDGARRRGAGRRAVAAAAAVAAGRTDGGVGGGGAREEREIAEVVGVVAGKDGAGGDGEAVVISGTGKAIGKVLGLGGWFAQRDGYAVKVRTGSVGAVDDVVEREGVVTMMDAEQDDDDAGEVLGARVRYTSSAQVIVCRS